MASPLFITASYDHNINFCQVDGCLSHCLVFPESQVNVMQISPDGRILAVAGYGVIKLYDPAKDCVNPILGATEPNLISGNVTGVNFIRLLNADTIVAKNENFRTKNSLLATLPYGLLVTGEDGSIKFFKLCSQPMQQQTPNSPAYAISFMTVTEIQTKVSITAAVLLPNQQLLVTGSQLGRVTMWHVPAILGLPSALDALTPAAAATSSQESVTSNDNNACSSNESTPAGECVGNRTNFGPSATSTAGARQESAGGGVNSGSSASALQRPLQELALESDPTPIRSIAVAPCGNFFAVATSGGKLHVLCLCRGDEAMEFCRHSSSAGAFQGGSAKSSQRYSAGDREERPSAEPARYPSSSSSSSSSPAAAAAAAAAAPTVTPTLGLPIRQIRNNNPYYDQTFNPFVMEEYVFLQAHHRFILKCAVSPNGRYIVTTSADYSVCLWGVPDPLVQGKFVLFPDLVLFDNSCLGGAEKPPVDNKALFAVKSPGGASSPASFSPPNEPPPAATAAGAAVFGGTEYPSCHPSGTLVNGGISQNLAHEIFPLRRTFRGHQRWVWDCAVSACSGYIFTVSSDRTARMWCVEGDLSLPPIQPDCPAISVTPVPGQNLPPPNVEVNFVMMFSNHSKPVNCCLLVYRQFQQ